jgi:hypothetical protein
MNEFRIIQTQPLTEALPFIIQERRQVWYLPWPIWRSIKEWTAKKNTWSAPRKFQSLDEAHRHIERRQAARAKRHAQQKYYTRQQELPRVIQLVHVPAQG